MKSELVRATNHLNIGKGRCNGWIEQPDEIKSGIYCWTNKVNGKRYVGQSVNLRRRKSAFLSFTSTFNYGGDYINKARQHYNHPSDWSYIIVEYCAVDALDDREIDYIAQYGTTDRERGYNASTGGESARGVIQTAETISKRANSNKKVIQQLDPDTLEVIREWNGIIDAAHSLGLKSTSSIIKCCNGQFYQAGGFKWCYKGESNRIKKGHYVRPSRPILQVDKFDDIVIKEWESSKEASKYFKVTIHQICECLNGSVKTAGGFRWCYADEGITPEWSEKTRATRWKRIMQIDPTTNEVVNLFDNAEQAAKTIGADSGNILHCCNTIRNNKTVYGYKWAFEGTELNEGWVKQTTNTTIKKVKQIDPKTGEVVKVWDMMTEAADFYKVCISCICACCLGRQKTSAGYKWEYADK